MTYLLLTYLIIAYLTFFATAVIFVSVMHFKILGANNGAITIPQYPPL